MIRAASRPAFLAPSIATQATGTPGGICTAESSASSPPRLLPRIGTPITGRSVWAAATPGSAADIPAPAMITLSPRIRAFLQYSRDHLGVAVGAHHPDLVADAGLVQRRAGRLHLRLVVRRAHDDPDQRRVDLDLLEGLLDLGHRRRCSGVGRPRVPVSVGIGSSEISLIWSSRSVSPGTRSTARAAMSVRICMPSKSISSAAS